MRTRPSAAMITAAVALVLSMGGAAFAANHYLLNSTKQISPKVLRALRGPVGPRGPQGSQGPKGAQGVPGPISGVLSSGVTLTGVYALRNINAPKNYPVETAVSFPLTLPASENAVWVPAGGSSTTCTGTAAHPTAPRGYFCVYEGVAANAVGQYIVDPATTLSTSTALPSGVVLRAFAATGGDTYSYGSWAVTAP